MARLSRRAWRMTRFAQAVRCLEQEVEHVLVIPCRRTESQRYTAHRRPAGTARDAHLHAAGHDAQRRDHVAANRTAVRRTARDRRSRRRLRRRDVLEWPGPQLDT